MVSMVNHGGNCCGMRHISGFNGYDYRRNDPEPINRYSREAPMSLYDKMKFFIKTTNPEGRNAGRVLEVVLTNQQCSANPQLMADLKELGFQLVNRFRNDNSRSICNVFHFVNGSRMHTRKPFRW